MQVKVLALCGSQRAASWSGALLRAARQLAPTGMEVEIFEDHKRLPLFNPDLEGAPPAEALSLRAAVTAADAILIASPEYAHGVTGTIKNTLDWLVSHEPFAFKPVALFNPAYQSYHADEALKETLRMMSADLVAGACVRIPVIGSGVALDAIASAPQFAQPIGAALREILARAISNTKEAP
jgi:NAD(P)H-dependent FMN reductase